MISTAERATRSLKTGKRTFFLVVAILSLAFCLLGQMVLSFYSFYQAHRGVMGDEATIFIDPTLNDKETEKLVQKIQSLTPASSMREIQPADVLEKDILKLVEARKKVPLILALQFPADVSVSEGLSQNQKCFTGCELSFHQFHSSSCTAADRAEYSTV